MHRKIINDLREVINDLREVINDLREIIKDLREVIKLSNLLRMQLFSCSNSLTEISMTLRIYKVQFWKKNLNFLQKKKMFVSYMW